MVSNEKKNIYVKRSRELLDRLNDVDELDWLEAKSLRDDTSRSILETVCSFSNEPGLGGGVILIGVAESKNADGPRYVVDGVDDPDKAQLDLATQCKSVFNTPVYPTIKVEKLQGKTVLKVVVDELPFGHKPVYFKKDGLPKGAYRRIGSADLVSKEEDLWRFYEDPESKYDETPNNYHTSARNEYSSRRNDDTSGRNEYSSRCNDGTSTRGHTGCASKKDCRPQTSCSRQGYAVINC